MLGEAFYYVYQDDYDLRCTDIDVNEKWLSCCDITDCDAYKKDVFDFDPDYLFHLGALTDLEYCELHRDETYLTNTLSVENAVYISEELTIPILYISTAGIFHGKKIEYDDWDVPNPVGYYARSKYAAEVFVKENAKRYIICRPGWMMGGGPRKDKKFIHKLMKQIKEGSKELFIVNDKLGTPTYTYDFAKNVRLLLEKNCWGLYNMACQGSTSRLEVANELVSIIGLQKEIKIIEVSSEFFKKEYFAARPKSERLLNSKLRLQNLDIMRDWKITLKEYMSDYYADYL